MYIKRKLRAIRRFEKVENEKLIRRRCCFAISYDKQREKLSSFNFPLLRGASYNGLWDM